MEFATYCCTDLKCGLSYYFTSVKYSITKFIIVGKHNMHSAGVAYTHIITIQVKNECFFLKNKIYENYKLKKLPVHKQVATGFVCCDF